MKRRDDLEGAEKAVATVLDDWLFRFHGITSSHANQDAFIELLREEGYEIREVR